MTAHVVGPAPSVSADGSRVVFTKVAGMDLSGERVVRPLADGRVVYATAADLSDANRSLWLTLTAAVEDTDVICLAYGEATEAGWTWADSLPIFLGLNGALTQTPPTPPAAAFLLQVAAVDDDPTVVFFDPRNPYAFAP